MHRNPLFQHIALPMAAAGTALILSGCGTQSASTTGQSGATAMPGMAQAAAGSDASFNAADVAFAQMMIPDHRMTAKMAALAQKKAASADLKALAADMLQGQSKAAGMLEDWLKAWGKPASGDMAGMTVPGAMTDNDMSMLKSMSGMKFDMMFAQMMVKHHESSIQMARDEQAKGANVEAKAMAAKMVKTQQAQVEQLRKIANM